MLESIILRKIYITKTSSVIWLLGLTVLFVGSMSAMEFMNHKLTAIDVTAKKPTSLYIFRPTKIAGPMKFDGPLKMPWSQQLHEGDVIEVIGEGGTRKQIIKIDDKTPKNFVIFIDDNKVETRPAQ